MGLRQLFLLLIFLILTDCVNGQVKYEKEYRISRDEVPELALEFVNELGFKGKIKWYYEEGLNKTSIEAKTRHRFRKYSIEFNPQGEVEDIEIKIRFKSIPREARHKISKYFKERYSKYKICKTQVQFTGSPDALINAVSTHNFKINKELTCRYEIVVETKRDGKCQKLEYLFSDKGEMLVKSVVIWKNTDILEY